jgi:hypothetical protein
LEGAGWRISNRTEFFFLGVQTMLLRLLMHAALALSLSVLAACAPARQGREKGPAKATDSPSAIPPSFPKASFSHEAAPLGDMIRKIGQDIGGGIVALSGLEERSVPALSLQGSSYQSLVQQLAAAVECKAAPLSHAWFIYPEPYEALLQVSLEGRLHERFAAMNASIAFGAKTRLSNVFAVLSESLGTTIVADNYLAEAACGELFMEKAPLQTVLEAVLMSARIPAQEIAVDCTDEYLFIASLRNTAPKTALLSDENSLSPAQKALLERVVDVVLPDAGENPVQSAFAAKAAKLQDVLTPLTRQMNIEVAAKRALAAVPIYPCTMHKVRIRTAMDLIIRQWPLATFGYEVTENQLLIRPR